MLTHSDVRAVIHGEIRTLLLEDYQELGSLQGHELLTDLGLNSLQLARLVIALEAEFGTDPFGTGEISLADLRSVDEVAAAYVRAMEGVETPEAAR